MRLLLSGDSTPFIVPALKAGIREWGYCCQVCFTSPSITTSLALTNFTQIFAVWWGNSAELQITFARLINSVRATSKTALVIGHMWVIATCTTQHSFNQTPETCMLQLLASKYRNYHLKLLRWSTTSTITSSNSFNMSVCTRDTYIWGSSTNYMGKVKHLTAFWGLVLAQTCPVQRSSDICIPSTPAFSSGRLIAQTRHIHHDTSLCWYLKEVLYPNIFGGVYL